jgi:6-pyruvoyltetrahydropterin/6-carboxytetrahydropterin synthase
MSMTVTVRHHMSAGHRIVGLGGEASKCANLHGHTFGIEWTFHAPDLAAQTVEFGAIKSTVRGWVDKHMDHGYIAAKDDALLVDVLVGMGVKHYLTDHPPTTETIATTIATVTQRLLPDLQLLTVHVTEGPHNAATWAAQ